MVPKPRTTRRLYTQTTLRIHAVLMILGFLAPVSRLEAQCPTNCGFALWASPGGAGYLMKGNGYPLINVSSIYQDNAGNLGIGTTNPGNKLTVNGDFWANALNATDGSVQYMRVSGNLGVAVSNPDVRVVISGNCKATRFIETSDARLKENVAPLDASLKKVTMLRGVTYNLVNDPEGATTPREEIGLIAQEVEKVLPAVVQTDLEGYKSIEYTRLISVLIEAIKEQQREISKLKNEIAQLKK